jgi:hypothetical protein
VRIKCSSSRPLRTTKRDSTTDTGFSITHPLLAWGGIKERRRISIRNPEVIHERIKVANDDFDGAIGDKRFKEAADQKSNTFFHHAKERPT